MSDEQMAMAEPSLPREPASPRPSSRVDRWLAWLTWVARPALLVYWPLLFYLTHSAESPSVNAALATIKHVHPDKWAHLFTYMLLTVLMVFSNVAGRRAGFLINLTLGCIIVGVYAFADELTQGMFGRTISGADVTADLTAVSIVYITLLLIHPQGRALPWGVLAARILLAIVMPLSGVMLINEHFGEGVEVWRIVPEWMGYIRGDYVAHFLGGLGATLLLGATAPLGAGRGKARSNAIFTFTVMALIAPLIEWMQHRFTERGAEWRDVQAHMWGMFAAAVVWAVWIALITLLRRRGLLRDRPEQATPGAAPGALPGSPSGSKSDSLGEDAANTPERFVGHAIIVGVMTLISRFTGLVRDAVLAGALGLSATADAFSIGFLIPNLFRRLFGEGALTAAFIPIYTDLVRKDRLTAQRLASLCIAVMVVFLGGLTLVGELVLLAMAGARQWSGDTALALRLTMIMLPYMPMICIVALIGGILQVHGKFGAPAAAPIFLNLVMIAGTVAAVKVSGGVETAASTTHAVVLISWTVLVAGLMQLLWQLAMVLRIEKFTTIFTGAGPAFRRMLAMMIPMFIGLGVFQINTLGDYLIAFTLSAKSDGPQQLHLLGMTLDYPMTTGDVAALTWAQRLYQFPLGVFGIAVATAIFPALSRAAGTSSEFRVPSSELKGKGEERHEGTKARRHGGEERMKSSEFRVPSSELKGTEAGRHGGEEGQEDKSEIASTRNPELETRNLISPDFTTILHHGLRLTFFIGLPASAGLILLRVPITRLIYERGEFGLAESQRVAMVMVGYCAVIWAYSMTHVLTRAFYAVKDAKTPLKISLRMVALNLVLNLLLIWPLGVAGLAWASAISAVMQVALMTRALRGVVPVVVGKEVLKGWRLTAMLTGVMTATLLPLTLMFDAAQMTRTESAMQLLMLLPLGAAIVLGGAWLFEADELKWLRRRSVK